MEVQLYTSEGQQDLYLLKPAPEEIQALVRLIREHGSQRGLGAAGVMLEDTGELVVYGHDYREIIMAIQAGGYEPLTLPSLN